MADELDRIELESGRLENLVDEVLSLLRESSGPQELKLSRFDLAELLQDLVENVNYEIGDGREPITTEAAATVAAWTPTASCSGVYLKTCCVMP